MNKVLFIVTTALIFASCGNSQQTADKANQERIDSLSQALTKQHIIDSMNVGSTENLPAGAAAAPVRHSHTPSGERQRPYSGGAAPANNVAPAPQAPAYVAPQAVANTVAQPSAADLAAQKKADHKKELTRAAEGALIGAGAGAIGGAIAGKNDKFKKQDAAIGGGIGAVLGAGTGLLLEKRKLKKDSTRP